MCIVFFQQFGPPTASGLSPEEQAIAERYAFILASNRDEYFTRPTQRAHLWEQEAAQQHAQAEGEGEVILAGKDLLGGGTWLGLTKSGRVSVLTNYRTPGDDAAAAGRDGKGGNGDGHGGGENAASAPPVPVPVAVRKKRSRGQLVLDYLHNREGGGPLAYAERVVAEGAEYAGFNLMVGSISDMLHPPSTTIATNPSPPPPPALVYVSNKAAPPLQPLAPNRLHAMANRLLDTPWEKLIRGKGLFRDCLARAVAVGVGNDEAVARLFLHGLLNDGHVCAPATDTGYGVEVEAKLASICIQGVCLREGAPLFGTSTQMVVLARRDGKVVVYERMLQPGATEEEERRSQLPDWHWSEVERFELALTE